MMLLMKPVLQQKGAVCHAYKNSNEFMIFERVGEKIQNRDGDTFSFSFDGALLEPFKCLSVRHTGMDKDALSLCIHV
jgi:hypothetical protein